MALPLATPTLLPRPRPFRPLEHPARIVASLTPNWFASIMGTGIVATAAATLPLQVPGLRAAATAVWALAAALLVALSVATALHWTRHRAAALRQLTDPVMVHFTGAPPMALLTVGAGALLLGRDWIGLPAAVEIDLVLWTIGTALGLACAVAVPWTAFTRHRPAPDSAFGGWLMPVVPPMVSASTGALLLPHVAAGQPRETLLWACCALFGLSLVGLLIVIGRIWDRLVHHGVGPAAMVPTLWIVLGPLGQSITAANLLAGNAGGVVGAGSARVLTLLALVFGFAVLGFALLWAALAALITLATVRRGLPFSLTWWSFTFPVGTCVTGLNGLALHSGLVVVQGMAVAGFAALVIAWAVVACRTFYGSVVRGTLLAPVRAAG